ncbi:hypothetical protein IWX65_000442 [Arthrobacter sp. CAN_A214]
MYEAIDHGSLATSIVVPEVLKLIRAARVLHFHLTDWTLRTTGRSGRRR